MIKAFYTVRPFDALVKNEAGTFEDDTKAYPIYAGSLITVINAGGEHDPNWLVRWDKETASVPEFGERLFRYILNKYDYEFNEISVVMRHKVITNHKSLYGLTERIANDEPIDFDCYDFFVYSVIGHGRVSNLPMVKGVSVDNEWELLEHFQELAASTEHEEYNKGPIGLWISQMQYSDGYTHWYRLMIRRAIKGRIDKVDLRHKQVTLRLADGTEFRPMSSRGGWIDAWLEFIPSAESVLGAELIIEYTQSFKGRTYENGKEQQHISAYRTKVLYFEDLEPSIEKQNLTNHQAMKMLEKGLLMFQ